MSRNLLAVLRRWFQGQPGIQGATGLSGLRGVRGSEGPQGVQGPPGIPGPAGFPGLDGEQGYEGPTGVQGPQGLPGLQGERGSEGAPGPQGIPGASGAAGPEGPPGPQGVPGPQLTPAQVLEDWPIHLKVPIVVVYDGPESVNDVWFGQAVLTYIERFFRETCNIHLQVTVEGDTAPGWDNEHGYGDKALVQHQFKYQARPFVVMLRPDLSQLGTQFLGEAFPGVNSVGGFCAVAGNQAHANQTAVHELGHLLGLAHLDGTFMRAALEVDNRIVTTAQRAKVRETAYQFGGL